MMDAEKHTTPADLSLERLVCSSFPPLDPNGQPFSMILRGIAADLGELRCTLSSYPTAREQLQVELRKSTDADCDIIFGDVEEDQRPELESTGLEGGHGSNAHMGDRNVEATGTKKRDRGVEGEDSGSDDEEKCDDGMENREHLILYLPFIRCTCSSWNMKGVSGDLFVTSLRVFFLSEKEKENGTEQLDDVAIDGCCIALHAVDSVPPSHGENEPVVSHHVYCQLADPAGDEGDIKYTSAASMVAPTEIVEEKCDASNGDGDVQAEEEEEDGISKEDSTVEIYFQPINSDAGEDNHSQAQCNKCQRIFDSFTKLVSLNPAGDADGGFNGGGGLFSMLSLMAGIDNSGNGFDGEMMFANHDDDSDDDMVFRLGGSNNLVENDDESEGPPEDEREAMLRRLDGMLVVPPEYEVGSSEDGQFEDAEEDDGDDGIL